MASSDCIMMANDLMQHVGMRQAANAAMLDGLQRSTPNRAVEAMGAVNNATKFTMGFSVFAWEPRLQTPTPGRIQGPFEESVRLRPSPRH